MAKIYTASEAYKIIRQGINKTAMQEIAEQAPVFAMYAAKGADEIVSALPDFITAQKIEKAIKGENIPDAKPEPEKAAEPVPVPTVETVATVAEEPKQEKEQTTAEEKPKGKRGRPAKAKEEKPDAEEQPKKKRGRPAKVKAPEPVEEVEEEQDEGEQEEETEPDEPETEEPEDDDDDWEI